MKLFYSPGACSLSCHIALEESGLPYTAVKVDWAKQDEAQAELHRLNPVGAVPVLLTDENKGLTQNIAILTHIAERAPKTGLLPPPGTIERSESMRWLATVSTDIHKSLSVFFAIDREFKDENAKKEVHAWALRNLDAYLTVLDQQMAGKDYFMAKQFTVADGYLFTVYSWMDWLELSREKYKNLNAHHARVAQRPAVQKVMKTEGLLD